MRSVSAPTRVSTSGKVFQSFTKVSQLAKRAPDWSRAIRKLRRKPEKQEQEATTIIKFAKMFDGPESVHKTKKTSSVTLNENVCLPCVRVVRESLRDVAGSANHVTFVLGFREHRDGDDDWRGRKLRRAGAYLRNASCRHSKF